MSIENITTRILNESTENAKVVVEKAKAEGKLITDKAKQEAKAYTEKIQKQSAEDAVILKNRKISVAELEARKMRLAAKQEAVNKSFEKALDKLADMKEEDYVDFLVKKINEVMEIGGAVVLNKRDRDSIGNKVVEKVNAGAKGKPAVTLSEDTIGARGGFVLRSGSVEINSTLETMVGAVREDATSEVVGALFR